jgi:hypothetical protein
MLPITCSFRVKFLSTEFLSLLDRSGLTLEKFPLLLVATIIMCQCELYRDLHAISDMDMLVVDPQLNSVSSQSHFPTSVVLACIDTLRDRVQHLFRISSNRSSTLVEATTSPSHRRKVSHPVTLGCGLLPVPHQQTRTRQKQAYGRGQPTLSGSSDMKESSKTLTTHPPR